MHHQNFSEIESKYFMKQYIYTRMREASEVGPNKVRLLLKKNTMYTYVEKQNHGGK